MNSQQMMEEIDRLARLCEAKDAEITPLRREVAMLRDVLTEQPTMTRVVWKDGIDLDVPVHYSQRKLEALSDSQATALAYEREVKARALEEFKRDYHLDGHGYTYTLRS